MSCHCEALDCAVRSHLVLHAWVMTAQLMQFITADACHWFCCASGSSVLAFNISSLWPLQLVWINGLFGFLMIWPPSKSSVCIFLQVLSPRPVPADDAVLCSRRFESSAHYSGGVEAGLSGRRRLRGTHTATGQSTNSIWACWLASV